MKKLLLFIILALTIFPDEIGFSIISTGHFQGNYRSVDSIKVAIDQLEKEKFDIHTNVIKINLGNNMTEYEIKNELLTSFVSKVNFNFNFLGRTEFIWREHVDYNKLKLSTLNILSKDILPYQLMKMDNYMVAVAGITDIYKEDIQGNLPYRRELTNLMYMLEDNVDFFFLVSDLDREENIRILQEFPHINAIFESRENLYDFGVEKVPFNDGIKESYIIPNHGISVIDFYYNKEIDHYEVEQIGFRLKKARVRARENVLNPQRFGYDRDLTNYISWTDEKVRNENSLIIGYNENSFNPYEIHLNSEVEFLDDLADKIIKDFDADLVIYPKSSLLRGLKKGLFTRLEVQNMFATEKFIEFTLSREKLKMMTDIADSHRGKEGYFYLSGLDKHPLRAEYKIISTENILKDYKSIIDDKDYIVHKIGIREYMINR